MKYQLARNNSASCHKIMKRVNVVERQTIMIIMFMMHFKLSVNINRNKNINIIYDPS